MRKALLLAALLLVGGPSLAQSQFKDAIKGAVQGATLDEIIQWSNAQFRRQATIGRYVRWGGSIVLGAALVAAGLDYFYNYLKRQTGTSLDQWYNWVAVPYAYTGRCIDRGSYRDWYAVMYQWNGSSWVVYGSTYATSDYRACNGSNLASFTQSWLSVHVKGVPEPYRSAQWGQSSSVVACPSGWTCMTLVPNVQNTRPALSDWLTSHPDAANGVKTAVGTYLDSVPIGSPSAPYPGVQFEPVPNPNQWTDNPFTRPDIDTDGDGWPDPVEWKEANRRGVPWPDVINDPNAYPDPNGDPDGDGWPTLKEVELGTDPYDATSKPSTGTNPATRSPDTDGDGWPDDVEISQGTDPRNPASHPVDTDGDGWPDTEETKQGTNPQDPASHPEGQPPAQQNPENPNEPQWPGGPAPVKPGEVALPAPPREERQKLPRVSELQELWQPFEQQVLDRWREELGRLRQQAANKFPFAILTAWNFRVETGSSECAFTVPIAEWQAQVDICNTPFWQAAATFRPILGMMVWVGAVFLLIRRALDIQG